MSRARELKTSLISSALEESVSEIMVLLAATAWPISSARVCKAFATSRPPSAITRAISPVRTMSASCSAVDRAPSVWSMRDDQRIEVGRDFVRAACRMLFEGVKLRLDGAARFAAAFREGVGERFSLDGDQPIHFLEPSAHRVGQSSRPLSKSARTGPSRDS